MPTDDDRREVARRLRDCVKNKAEGEMLSLNGSSAAIRWLISSGVFGDKKYHSGADLIYRLADLIEPTDGFDLDTVQRVCFECMEGCDEPEWTLYATIHDAIARYRRGESGPSCDRDALLALADEMEAGPRRERCPVAPDCSECAGHCSERLSEHYARRIREACGEHAS